MNVLGVANLADSRAGMDSALTEHAVHQAGRGDRAGHYQWDRSRCWSTPLGRPQPALLFLFPIHS